MLLVRQLAKEKIYYRRKRVPDIFRQIKIQVLKTKALLLDATLNLTLAQSSKDQQEILQ